MSTRKRDSESFDTDRKLVTKRHNQRRGLVALDADSNGAVARLAGISDSERMIARWLGRRNDKQVFPIVSHRLRRKAGGPTDRGAQWKRIHRMDGLRDGDIVARQAAFRVYGAWTRDLSTVLVASSRPL